MRCGRILIIMFENLVRGFSQTGEELRNTVEEESVRPYSDAVLVYPLTERCFHKMLFLRRRLTSVKLSTVGMWAELDLSDAHPEAFEWVQVFDFDAR